MSTAPSRPDLEDLAAYLDGRLDAEGRAAVELRLAEDEDYYEVFLETTRFQREEASRRGPWVSGLVSTLGSKQARRGWLAAGAVAAALVLAVGWSLRPAPDPLARADSVDLLRVPQVLADPGFKVFRSANSLYSREDLAYRLGVWTVDLEVLLRVRDSAVLDQVEEAAESVGSLDGQDSAEEAGSPEELDSPSSLEVEDPQDSDFPDAPDIPNLADLPGLPVEEESTVPAEAGQVDNEALLIAMVSEIREVVTELRLFRLSQAIQLDFDRPEEVWNLATDLPQRVLEEVRGRDIEEDVRLGRWVETARLASAMGNTSVLSLALRVPRSLRKHVVLVEHRDKLADLRAKLETLPETSGEPWEPGVDFFRNLNRQLGGPSGF